MGKTTCYNLYQYYCTMPTRKVYVMKENSVAANRAKRNVGDKPYALWGGGSATIVSPTEENNGDIILAELQCVPSVVGSRVMNINNVKVVDTSNNKRKRDDDPLIDPEETEFVQVQVVEPTPLVTSIHKPQRPVSLSLKPAAGGHIEGVPIETPSNGILSFDAIMESRTGLTPTSILTPIKTTSNLNTPTCGTQHKSSLIFTPLFSPNTEATLLTSL